MKSTKLLSCLVVLLVFSAFVFASGATMNLSDLTEKQLEILSEDFVGQKLPAALRAVFGEERINFYVDLNNEKELVISIVTVDGKVESVLLDEVDSPTLRIYTDQDTLEKIALADDPAMEVRKALDDRSVTFKANSFVKRMKFYLFFKLSSIFGGDDRDSEITGGVVVVNGENTEATGNLNGGDTESSDEVSDVVWVDEGDVEVSADDTSVVVDLDESETEVDDGEGIQDSIDQTNEEEQEEQQDSATVSKEVVMQLINSGFEKRTLTINKGETVVWKNVRNGRIKQAMIVGARYPCTNVRSGIFYPGDSFKWTFEETGTCTIVDGILTTETMKVIVR